MRRTESHPKPFLLPYITRFVQAKNSVRIARKSRRIGFSYGLAADCSYQASLGRSQGGCDVTYIGYDKPMTRQFIEDCTLWAKIYGQITQCSEEIFRDSEDRDSLAFRLRFASGFEIEALSSKPRNVRSRKGRFVLDELAAHDYPEELLNAALAAIVWGGRIDILSTVNADCPYFEELCLELAPKRGYYVQEITFDQAIDEGLYDLLADLEGKPQTEEALREWRSQIILEYGPAAKQELFCIPDEAGASLFQSDPSDLEAFLENPAIYMESKPWHEIDAASVGSFKPLVRSHKYLLCVDPSFGAAGGDYYVAQIWDCTQWPIALAHEYGNNYASSETHAEKVVSLIKEYKPEIVVFEGNGGGQPMAERVQLQFPRLRVEVVMTTQTNKRINTDRLALLVKNKQVIFPKTWAGIGEMKLFSRLKREAIRGHDDRITAWAVGMAFLDEIAPSLAGPGLRSAEMTGPPLGMMPKYKEANVRAPLPSRGRSAVRR